MAKAIECFMTGDPQRAKAATSEMLAARDFRLNWSDEWTAVAEKGSKGKTLLVGGFAQYLKLGLRVMDAGNGESVVRVEQLNSGASGGVLGMRKASKNMTELREMLAGSGAFSRVQ